MLSACLKEVPLRLVSGNQARAQASEAEGGMAPVDAAEAVREATLDEIAGVAIDDNGTAARTVNQ